MKNDLEDLVRNRVFCHPEEAAKFHQAVSEGLEAFVKQQEYRRSQTLLSLSDVLTAERVREDGVVRMTAAMMQMFPEGITTHSRANKRAFAAFCELCANGGMDKEWLRLIYGKEGVAWFERVVVPMMTATPAGVA